MAGSSKGSTPPTLDPADPAIVKHIGRRVKQITSEGGLFLEAVVLYEEVTLMVETFSQARDQIAAMTCKKHLLEFFRVLLKDREDARTIAELTDELRRTQEIVKAQTGGSTSFTNASEIPNSESLDTH